MSRQIVKFETNKPLQIALEYPDGIHVPGQYGPQVKFNLTENRLMFVSPDVAQAIQTLGVQLREVFTVTKRWEPGRRTWWDIERVKTAKQPSEAIRGGLPPDSPRPPVEIHPAPVSAARPAISEPLPTRIAPQSIHPTAPPSRGMQLTRTPPVKPSYEEAFRECLRIVREGLSDAGEAWSDHSVQAMTSTLFIQAAREGTMRFTVPAAEKVA